MDKPFEPILDIRGLKTVFRLRGGDITAINDIDLTIAAGETVALVGESGSGKSVTSLSVMRLLARNVGVIAAGSIRFRSKDGSVRDLVTLDDEQMRKIRGNDIGMIFQEPMSSLNPVLTIGDQIAEPIRIHREAGRKRALDAAVQLLEQVGIPDAKRRIAHRVAVMYAGRIVEHGPVKEVFRNPRHPYTLGLLASMPWLGDATRMKRAGQKLAAIPGVVPSLSSMPEGCAFSPRCSYALDACRMAMPPLAESLPSVAGDWPMSNKPFISVRNLSKHYVSRGVKLSILDGISFDIAKGEVVGLVGESGSGKTTIGRSILRLVEPSSGSVEFDGTELTTLSASQMRQARRRLQYIFQDPFASLSPRMTIGQILTEGLKIQRIGTRAERLERARSSLQEIASSADLYAQPQHPYTRALLSAIPSPDPDAIRDRHILQGDIPSPANPPSGCVFRTRCPAALDACAQTVPQLREVAPGQFKACIRDDLN
eukprot:gene6517-8079_t